MSWLEKNRKINNRGGTIIRDSRVALLATVAIAFTVNFLLQLFRFY